MFNFQKKWQTAALWTAVTLIADLATKALVVEHFSQLEDFAVITVVPGFMNLILTYNTGAAFSLFASEAGGNQGLKMAVLSAISLLPFIYFYVKARPGDRLVLCALGLIWGGALGNIHDRLRWEAVVDFLDFYLGESHWPAFNVADIGICLGAGFLVLGILREKG